MDIVSLRTETDTGPDRGALPAFGLEYQPDPAAEPPLDQRILAELREMDEEGGTQFLSELIDAYLCHARSALPDLGCAVECRDAEAVRIAAHGFKSSSSSIGAVRLTALCQQLEKSGRAGLLERVDELLCRIQTEFRRVHGALVEVRDGIGGPV